MAVPPSQKSHLGYALLAFAGLATACVATIGEDPASREPPIEPAVPTFLPAMGNLRRLTTVQYQNTIRDLVGAEIVVPTRIEPDTRIEGLFAVGAGVSSTSRRGVEQFESAAYDVAGQAMGNAAVRARLVSCTPTGTVDDACAETFVRSFGRSAYRRPLSETEVTALVGVAHQASTVLDDFALGLKYAMAAMLQSPSFVYRVELGAPSATDGALLRYDSYELATRLSFFLWNSTPDAQLLAAADSGALATDDGLAAQVDRLLADERAHDGVRSFFTDMLQLADLDRLNKDPAVYVHFSPDVGPAARSETLSDVEQLVFEERGDFRDLLTSRRTFLDRKLASIYDVPAPTLMGQGELEYPAGSLRVGLLGQVSFLALHSHAASSSATLRGKFVREVLLCAAIPPPPANLNTAIPEASAAAPTLRDRVLVHFENPSCRGCHQLMDPIGLAFENFDGIGRFRTTENGAHIDASGSVNGTYYTDAAGLAEVLHDHPDVPRCLVRTMYRYATGHVEVTGETAALRELSTEFAGAGYRVLDLMRLVALNEGFRLARQPDTTPEVP